MLDLWWTTQQIGVGADCSPGDYPTRRDGDS
jgi:hypothetical protein